MNGHAMYQSSRGVAGRPWKDKPRTKHFARTICKNLGKQANLPWSPLSSVDTFSSPSTGCCCEWPVTEGCAWLRDIQIDKHVR